MKLNTYTIASLLALLPLACAEDVGSSSVRTKGLYAKYQAVATGNGKTQIVAELRVGGDNGTYLFLEPPDTLSASNKDKTVTLKEKANGEEHTYLGTLPGDEEGLEIQIDFDRGEAAENAPDSTVRLPAPFQLDLVGSADIERGNSVSLKWGKASGILNWEATGSCVKTASGTAADSGALTLEASDIEAWSSDEKKACEVTVTLERTKKGSVDAAFKQGGQFVATQRRTVSFNSLPKPSDIGAGGSQN
jgi:hypothetical protein